MCPMASNTRWTPGHRDGLDDLEQRRMASDGSILFDVIEQRSRAARRCVDLGAGASSAALGGLQPGEVAREAVAHRDAAVVAGHGEPR